MSKFDYKSLVLNPKSINAEEGANNDVLHEPSNQPDYDRTNAETVYQGQNNTWIVLGRDRYGDRTTGYGGKGELKCGAIDIVAGRISTIDTSVVKGKVNPSPAADAARLYLSQRSDIDTNFSLPVGSSGAAISKSAAALKADDIRLISRSSFKIVTGGEATYSNGNPDYGAHGIELIANVPNHYLEPMVLGEKLIEALKTLSDKVMQLNGIVAQFMQIQSDFNDTVAQHTHLSPFYGINTSPSETALPDGKSSVMKMFLKVNQGLKLNMNNLTAFQTNYLFNTLSSKHINSSYHKLN